MSALSEHVDKYLRLRRALGFKLIQPGNVLPQFVAWLDDRGDTTVTVDAALAWTRLSQNAAQITLSHRLGAIRGFARYMHTIDPATQIPPEGIFGKQQRQAPYIYTQAEITALLVAASQLRSPLRAATFRTLLGLLAATGMRLGEALRLARPDVDLAAELITIRHPKFDRDRLVPVHPSVTELLNDYADCRDRLSPPGRTETFFVSSTGTALIHSPVHATFQDLLAAAGLPTAPGRRPRIHDLRHAFAVETLIQWQRDGLDVASRLPMLSTYLGHVSPASTYWYLEAVPELMQHTAARLEAHTHPTSRTET